MGLNKTFCSIIAVLLICTLVTVNCCSTQRIQQCTSQFVTSAGGENPTMKRTKEEMDRLCHSVMPVFKKCLTRSSRDCPATVRKTFEGMFNGFDYVCNSGKEAALKHGHCIGSSNIKAQTESCKKMLNRELHWTKNIIAECGYFKEYLGCVKSAVELACGHEAAAYEDRVSRIVAAPVMETIGCEIEIYTPRTTTLRDTPRTTTLRDTPRTTTLRDLYQSRVTSRSAGRFFYPDNAGSTITAPLMTGWMFVFSLLLVLQ